LRFRTADLTATRKRVPICLPRPSAPLQSLTTHVSRLCSSSLGSAPRKPGRTHFSQPPAPIPKARRIALPVSARRQPPAHDGAVACIQLSPARGSAGRILVMCPSPHPPPKRTMSCRDGRFKDETEAPSPDRPHRGSDTASTTESPKTRPDRLRGWPRVSKRSPDRSRLKATDPASATPVGERATHRKHTAFDMQRPKTPHALTSRKRAQRHLPWGSSPLDGISYDDR
jgi:hypothetical protein